jgi:DNA-binding NarL/FixJ family response regulator
MAVTVAVQAQQRFYREGLEMILAAEPDIEVAGAVRDARDLARLCHDRRPDVVLLELDAREWDTCRLAAALRKRHRSLTVIGMWTDPDRALGYRAYQAGIRTVLAHDGGVAAVLQAVRQRSTRPSVVVPLPAPLPPKVEGPGHLTGRELEVLKRIGAGCTIHDISSDLGISAKTVGNHKQRIFAKLGVQNQAHAVAVAMRRGLLGAGVALAAARS